MSQYFLSSAKRSLTLLGGLMFVNAFFFVAKQAPFLRPIRLILLPSIENNLFYFLFLVLGLLIVATLFLHPLISKRSLSDKILLLIKTLLPTLLMISYGVGASKNFHFVFQIGSGLGLIVSLALLYNDYINSHALLEKPEGLSVQAWFRSQGAQTLLLVLFLTGVFFSFGLWHLGKFAAVDEPLWLYGRITKYWNNVSEMEWQKTDVSDKPGITVAIISGAGLFQYEPKKYDDTRHGGEVFVNKSLDMEAFFRGFRLPILLAITLLLPLVYFLLERLLGKEAAILPYAILATSPLLIGVAKIINPDALLWIFTTLSLLSFLVFQKRPWYRYLILSGFFLGLGLLTKYIANILYVYLLLLLFLEYLYHERHAGRVFSDYLKQTLLQIGLVIFVSLATFYILLPANWVDPYELIQSTLLSQAFAKVAPLFVFLIGVLVLDQLTNNSRISTAWFNLLSRFKNNLALIVSVIFFGAVLFTLGNTWAGMPVFNFMDLIASPKTIDQRSGLVGMFLTNFYPLVFGMTPLALLGILASSFFLLRKNFYRSDSLRLAFYAMIFALVYYLGATVNGVASIIRYQIIVFPLIALLAGIGLYKGARFFEKKYSLEKGRVAFWGSFVVGIVGVLSLLHIPFPLSYASNLLPNKYYIDLKDMGPGSYEIAQQLNTLPDAKNTLIWTDKDGVCQFFMGRCVRGNDKQVVRDKDIDYIVVSSAREVRTGHMVRSQYNGDEENVIPFHLYYETEQKPDFQVLINGRSSHFVKAYRYIQE